MHKGASLVSLLLHINEAVRFGGNAPEPSSSAIHSHKWKSGVGGASTSGNTDSVCNRNVFIGSISVALDHLVTQVGAKLLLVVTSALRGTLKKIDVNSLLVLRSQVEKLVPQS